MSDEQAIRDGERIQAFLADDAVKAARQQVEQGYIAGWRAATTKDTREAYHAKLAALDDVWTALAATVSDGERAKAKRAREELVKATEARNRPKR